MHVFEQPPRNKVWSCWAASQALLAAPRTMCSAVLSHGQPLDCCRPPLCAYAAFTYATGAETVRKGWLVVAACSDARVRVVVSWSLRARLMFTLRVFEAVFCALFGCVSPFARLFLPMAICPFCGILATPRMHALSAGCRHLLHCVTTRRAALQTDWASYRSRVWVLSAAKILVRAPAQRQLARTV